MGLAIERGLSGLGPTIDQYVAAEHQLLRPGLVWPWAPCWIVRHPLAGDVIPAAEGARKVRWTVAGAGKPGGTRVIYFNRLASGLIYLVAIYRKVDQTNIRPGDISEID